MGEKKVYFPANVNHVQLWAGKPCQEGTLPFFYIRRPTREDPFIESGHKTRFLAAQTVDILSTR